MSSCELLLQNYPKLSEVEELHSTFIANCVFNNVLCYSAILWNIVAIHAIRKTSLSKTLETLLLSLDVSDVGVGLVGQPFFTSLLVKWLKQENISCSTYKVFVTITQFFTAASFLGVLALSVDRFLAIHLHLRYQELVTHKRVVAVVTSVWVLSVFLSSLTLWVPYDVHSLINFILGVVGLVLTTLVYINIYLTVRRHSNQVQALQVQQVSQTEVLVNFAGLVKAAVGLFYVYLVFLFCYLPYFISSVALKIYGPCIVLKRFFISSFLAVYLNSSLNPVIYCWKMRHIRHAIMDILRNMSWLRNRTSH